jgi:hypothetical protein
MGQQSANCRRPAATLTPLSFLPPRLAVAEGKVHVRVKHFRTRTHPHLRMVHSLGEHQED